MGAEAAAEGAGLAALLQAGAEFSPVQDAPRRQFLSGVGPQARAQASHDANRSPQHQTGGRGFAAGTAAFMVSGGAEELLQGVIGPGQVGNLIAMEQAGQVAGRDFQEVPQGRARSPGPLTLPSHRPQMGPVLAADDLGGAFLGVAENRGGLLHQAKGVLDRRPECGGLGQALSEDGLQLRQGLGEPLFSFTRCKLADTSCSRPWSFRPLATSGGRPSSVSAERTAEQ